MFKAVTIVFQLQRLRAGERELHSANGNLTAYKASDRESGSIPARSRIRTRGIADSDLPLP